MPNPAQISRRLGVDEIRSALAAGSGPQVALLGGKVSPRNLAETLAALANAHGGLVILGAGAAGAVAGLAEPEQARSMAMTATLAPVPPLIVPLPELVELDGRVVCVVEVPPGLPHVYSIKGQYLVRTGARNRHLLPDELRRLILERGDAGFEAQVLPEASRRDLDDDKIIAYVEQLGGLAAENPTALLLGRGCLVDTPDGPRPTVAGIILFGIEPQRWLRSAEIVCVRYPGNMMSDDFVREDIRGVLPDQVRRAEAFVASNMRRGMRIRGLAREDTPEYPISVVREAIVNAVSHRDYSVRGDSIRVLMFNDRLEVYSPGRLPGHVTLDNLLTERYSRNEAIVQVLSELGFIERLGYGIDRMIAVCENEGLARPRFIETAAGFKVTIYGHGPSLVGAAPPTSMWSHLHLNPRQEQALTFLKDNRRITNRDYQTLCPDASPETLRRDLADLVDRGLLLKVGEKRATYYMLK